MKRFKRDFNALCNNGSVGEEKSEPCEKRSCEKIAVMVYGGISKKMYNIWEKEIPRIITSGVIDRSYSDDSTVIVSHEGCSLEKVLAWAKQESLPKQCEVVTQKWAFQLVKTGCVPSTQDFRHPVLKTAVFELKVPNPSNVSTERYNNSVSSSIVLPSTTVEVSTSTGPVAPPSLPHRSDTILPMSTSIPLPKHIDPSKFACYKGGNNTNDPTFPSTAAPPPANPNKFIIDVLKPLQEMYDTKGDQFRSISYKRAIDILKKKPKITNISELKSIKGFGKSLLDKIEEILETGSLEKLENFQADPHTISCLDLCNIWGVGRATAENLIVQGYKSVECLRTILDTGGPGALDGILTNQQQIGLKHFDDILARVPRAEISELFAVVKDRVLQLYGPGFECVVCGSYRRGQSDSGDIDILIVPPLAVESVDILDGIIQSLSASTFVADGTDGKMVEVPPFLTDHLTLPSGFVYGESSSYMGVCKLPSPESRFRRIDIKAYPRSQFAFALLYFTGNDHFNRSMRFYAGKLGYTLTNNALAKCVRDKQRVKIAQGESLVCSTEEDIFEMLNLPYKEPWDRTCF